MNIYYVYAYIRSKDSSSGKAGTPYYIGKGKGNRAWHPHDNVGRPASKSHIVIVSEGLTELGAFAIERRLIAWYGKLYDGTGILRNIADGGEGSSHKKTPEHRAKLSKANLGKTIPQDIIDKRVKTLKDRYWGMNDVSRIQKNNQKQARRNQTVSEWTEHQRQHQTEVRSESLKSYHRSMTAEIREKHKKNMSNNALANSQSFLLTYPDGSTKEIKGKAELGRIIGMSTTNLYSSLDRMLTGWKPSPRSKWFGFSIIQL